jgi:hypothetical protein
MRCARADAHEAALDAVLDHQLREALREEERRLEIDRHDVVPQRARGVEQPAEGIDAGIADHDIGHADCVGGPRYEAGNRGLVGEVGDMEMQALRRQVQLAAQRGQPGGFAVAQHEARAFAGEGLGELAPIDAAGAGYDDDLAGEAHRSYSFGFTSSM